MTTGDFNYMRVKMTVKICKEDDDDDLGALKN